MLRLIPLGASALWATALVAAAITWSARDQASISPDATGDRAPVAIASGASGGDLLVGTRP